MSHNYDAWKIDIESFNKLDDISARIKFFARFGVLAPSTHNTQPWNITTSEDTVVVRPDLSRSLPIADPSSRYLYMSIGMCVENIAAAAAYYGYESKVSTDNEQVTIRFVQNITDQAQNIHPRTIIDRYSNKFPYKSEIPSKELMKKVESQSVTDYGRVAFVFDDERKSTVVSIHRQAALLSAARIPFIRELARHFRNNRTKKFNGMPAFTSGANMLVSLLIPKLLYFFPRAAKINVAKDTDTVVANSAGYGLVWLFNDNNMVSDFAKFVSIGRSYQRAALVLRENGIHDALITASMSQEETKEAIRQVFDVEGKPYLLFRYGYPVHTNIIHTPRYSL